MGARYDRRTYMLTRASPTLCTCNCRCCDRLSMSGAGTATNIKVAVRCRPFIGKEKRDECRCVVKVDGPQTTIVNPTGQKETAFTYDYSYFQDAQSSDVYRDLGRPLLEKALEGYNATIFAYGQTGSGKSYSMTGTEKEPGIIPLMNQALFDHIDSAPPNNEFLVTVSYLEIYQEVIFDLLNPHGKDMRIREHPQLGIYVEGLAELVVRNGRDIAILQEQGNRVRRVAETQMNQRSSRSHSVFTLHIKQRDAGTSSSLGLKSKVNLVDLAGSERADATGAQGQTLKEGAAINKSLSALGNVINLLADPRKKAQHIPYRDSKLTRILEESLGGNCVTVMLAMVSPADYNYSETLSTLQFANRAKNIKNTTRKNEDANTRMIRELREEIARLRGRLQGQEGPDSSATLASTEEVSRMETMISELQVAKQESWEEKERLSNMYEEERRKNLASKGILDLVMDTLKKGHQEAQERLTQLYEERDELTVSYKEKRQLVEEMKKEMEDKVNEYSKLSEQGQPAQSVTQAKLSEIHQLKEHVRMENEKLKDLKQQLKDIQEKIKTEKEESHVQSTLLQGNTELREMIASSEREKLERENQAILQEKLDSLKLEIEQEKAELKLKVAQGVNYKLEESVKMETELIELRAAKSMMTFQIETLEQQRKRLVGDLDEAYKKHKEDLEIQELQYFQTFRAYREAYEEQKLVIEKRFRTLLEQSLHDVIVLAGRNSQLTQQNQELRHELATLRDSLTKAGVSIPPTAVYLGT